MGAKLVLARELKVTVTTVSVCCPVTSAARAALGASGVFKVTLAGGGGAH